MKVLNASTLESNGDLLSIVPILAMRSYPIASYVLMIVLGVLPTALVSHYYGVLPNRMVIQWDMFGRMTVIGTRASTVLMVANFAAVSGLAGSVLAFWQHRSLVAIGALRAFLVLSLAQIVAINLTCAMLVTDALGMHLMIKPMIPAAMAVLLFAAGILCWRMGRAGPVNAALAISGVFIATALGSLTFSAFATNQVVGYYVSAFALLTMMALALPAKSR